MLCTAAASSTHGSYTPFDLVRRYGAAWVAEIQEVPGFPSVLVLEPFHSCDGDDSNDLWYLGIHFSLALELSDIWLQDDQE
jgi:hypothetical protein